jgi:hypothetical protein
MARNLPKLIHRTDEGCTTCNRRWSQHLRESVLCAENRELKVALKRVRLIAVKAGTPNVHLKKIVDRINQELEP